MKRQMLASGVLGLVLCVAPACGDRGLKAELDAVSAEKAAEERNKQVARDFIAAIDRQDFASLRGLLADGFALSAPGAADPLTADGLFAAIKAHYTAFPDWRHVIEDVTCEGEKVTVRLVQHGTHKAEYEGVSATGNEVHMAALHLARIVDGKVEEWWAVEDYLGLMTQLGMELKPKQASAGKR